MYANCAGPDHIADMQSSGQVMLSLLATHEISIPIYKFA